MCSERTKISLFSRTSSAAIQQPVSGAGLNEKTFPAYAHYVSCPFLQGSDNAVILNSGLVEHHGFGHNKVPIRQQCVLRFLYRIRVFMERQKYA